MVQWFYNSTAFFVTTTKKSKFKMASKFAIFALLITFAFAHGREIMNVRSNNDIMSTEKESRIIDIPLIGALFFLGCQVVGLVMSSIWSLLEFKLAALSLVSGLVSWLIRNYVIVIIGAVAVAGFCLVTSVFSSEPVYEIDHLLRAVRSIDNNGLVKFGRVL